jgi:ribonuclease VapC
MIAVDTSAIVAILKAEQEESRLRGVLERAGRAAISACNLLELQIVLAGRKPESAWPHVEALLAKYAVLIRSFDERQLRVAREAAVHYGKGRHKAGLNLGDCFAYALAKTEDLPLLCTGKDFAATDVAIA